MNYFKIYEFLYKNGYHARGKNHGQKYVDKLCNIFDFDTILEVGCSQGLTVGKFLKRRKLAFGIDVSLNAVKQATGKKYGIPNCIQASATDIPFIDNFVDAVFTCDVLEHLTESDIDKALDEIARVSSMYLFIVIDDKAEGNRDWIELGKQKYPELFAKIPNLHLTVQPIKWWIKKIETRGYKLIKRMQRENGPAIHCFKKI